MATMLVVKTVTQARYFLTFFTADKDLSTEWSVSEGHSGNQKDS